MTLNRKSINEIRKLRKQGLGLKTIAKQKKISPSTVCKYCKEIKLSIKARQKLVQNQQKNKREFIKKYAKEKKIKSPHLCEDFASVLGHLMFDGCVPTVTNGRYRINYTNSSELALKMFISKVQDVYGIKNHRMRSYKGKYAPWFMVEFYSKKLYFNLMKYSPSYSTSDAIGAPKIVMGAEDNIKAAFIRAFWDDEGAICNDGTLTGASKSEKMIDDLVKLHAIFGIKSKKYTNKTKTFFTIRIISNLKNYLKFQKHIDFEYAVVTKGHNRGMLKKDVFFRAVEKKLIKHNGVKINLPMGP